MFCECDDLINLDLSNFDTSNLTDMRLMFGCSSLTNLDLSGFDMSKVKYYEYDFLNNCPNLQVLITPKKTCDYLDLPFHMYDSASNEYAYIPVLSQSILLARTTEMAKGWCGTIYTSGDNLGNLTNEIHLLRPFEKCVFKTASTEYNPELAYYLAALCRSAYGLEKANKTIEEQMVNIRKSIASLGFENDFAYDYRDDTTPAYTIARKNVSNGSTMVLITIRGSYNLDWGNNINMGWGFLGFGKHGGYEIAANQIYNTLGKFLGGISTPNVTYVITGHSQGGAIGNLLAVKLYDNQVPISNVYNYNFSAPNSACLINPQDWNPRGIHDNVINIALDYDIVSFIPCNELPVCDANPLATWGKFGRSFWYVPSQEDAYLVGHDLKEVVYLLSHQYPLSKFSDYYGIPAGRIKHVLGIHCPVDVFVYNKSGTSVASVINDKAEYYDSKFGEVVIIIDGDEKYICLPDNQEYDVRLSATDVGEMTYEVFNVDFAKGEKIGQEKVFENVILIPGKEMYSDVDVREDNPEATLYVLDHNETIVAEINEDGQETAILVKELIIKDNKINLTVGDTVQLSAEIKPDIATNKTIIWESTNKNIVTVDSQGKVTAVGVGQAIIKAFSEDGGAKATVQLTCTALTPTPTSEPVVKGFSDVQNPKHAYYKAIYWAAEAGITKGYPDGTFGIDRSCTRGEMMMFLWRYAGKPTPKTVSKSPFKDVPKTHTFYKAILWGSQKGITKGYSDGTFGVNRNVSRGECMMFLWRLKGKPAPKAVAKAPFPDVPKSHVFYNAVLWGYQKKITTGFTSGKLKGKFGVNENCSRGQIVTFLYRAK